MSKNLKIGIGVAAAVVILLIGYSYINSVRGEAKSQENGLSTEYLDCQNYLSSFVSGYYELVNITPAAGDQLNEVLTNAVKGRYEDGGYSVNSPMFAAIVEAYPEASTTELMAMWSKVQDYIQSGREGYRNKQSKLLDKLRTYDNWLVTDIKRQVALGFLDFPSDSLIARVGDEKWTGNDAKEKMYQIVLVDDAVKAYETGRMAPLTVPKQ